MQKTKETPLWVFLAFSAIEKRQSALILIWSCVVFTLYCIPWVLFIEDQSWLTTLLLIDDWSWLAMMVPMVIWYVMSLRWMDKQSAWDK